MLIKHASIGQVSPLLFLSVYRFNRGFIHDYMITNIRNEPPKQCKIVEVIVPGFSRHNSSVDDVIESVGVEKRRNSLQIGI